ncbi:uncharacterized protein BcabD6B2_51150 [Babesia caballi]|uniref:Uncharacterized protein n=1 Tax=Babesia caballi TaxID=5871 RepID=A0AAV4M0F0_BABCB|nr:hypothetical protein BcabD6B2_51150 [Babesia caballi]
MLGSVAENRNLKGVNRAVAELVADVSLDNVARGDGAEAAVDHGDANIVLALQSLEAIQESVEGAHEVGAEDDRYDRPAHFGRHLGCDNAAVRLRRFPERIGDL